MKEAESEKQGERGEYRWGDVEQKGVVHSNLAMLLGAAGQLDMSASNA